MKILFASDLHGDRAAVEALLAAFHAERAERLVLLGDILYHGPRNDLPAAYDPKGVIALLNPLKEVVLAVRGNCDAEVDQMVLDFPIMADIEELPLRDGVSAYLTHGHHYNEQEPMPMQAGDVMIHGHTHVAGVTQCITGQICLNPGSVSMPKNQTPACYMIYEDGLFDIRRLSDGTSFQKHQIGL